MRRIGPHIDLARGDKTQGFGEIVAVTANRADGHLSPPDDRRSENKLVFVGDPDEREGPAAPDPRSSL